MALGNGATDKGSSGPGAPPKRQGSATRLPRGRKTSKGNDQDTTPPKGETSAPRKANSAEKLAASLNESNSVFELTGYAPLGLVHKHNQSSAINGRHWECITKNMLITSINGVSGDASKMAGVLRDIHGSKILDITIKRGAGFRRVDLAEKLVDRGPGGLVGVETPPEDTGVGGVDSANRIIKNLYPVQPSVQSYRMLVSQSASGSLDNPKLDARYLVMPRLRAQQAAFYSRAVAVAEYETILMKHSMTGSGNIPAASNLPPVKILMVNLQKTLANRRLGFLFFDAERRFREMNKALVATLDALPAGEQPTFLKLEGPVSQNEDGTTTKNYIDVPTSSLHGLSIKNIDPTALIGLYNLRAEQEVKDLALSEGMTSEAKTSVGKDPATSSKAFSTPSIMKVIRSKKVLIGDRVVGCNGARGGFERIKDGI